MTQIGIFWQLSLLYLNCFSVNLNCIVTDNNLEGENNSSILIFRLFTANLYSFTRQANSITTIQIRIDLNLAVFEEYITVINIINYIRIKTIAYRCPSRLLDQIELLFSLVKVQEEKISFDQSWTLKLLSTAHHPLKTFEYVPDKLEEWIFVFTLILA